jgi:hypothetical protein
MREITIGSTFRCEAVGIHKEVIGIVEKCYNNTVLINVIDYDTADRTIMIEMQHRLLVKYDRLIEEITVDELVIA